MPRLPMIALAALSLSGLTACDSAAERQTEAAEDGVEQQADASAAGPAQAALGLTETQLLEADLKAADGSDLGNVEQVRRDAGGTVTGLLIELDNSDPDRYVLLPMDGLTTRVDGDDTDLQTTMTAADLAAMPDAIR